MPAGVASAGLTMDGRIPALLAGRGDDHGVRLDEPRLGERTLACLHAMHGEREALRTRTLKFVGRQVRAQAEMGRRLSAEIEACIPGTAGLPADAPWARFLPKLDPALEALLAASE
jgi:hypothetical protein